MVLAHGSTASSGDWLPLREVPLLSSAAAYGSRWRLLERQRGWCVVAVAMLLEWDGMDEAAYRALVGAMDLGGTMFPGAVLHLAGPIEGGWRAVDVWESEEAFERFRTEKLGTALATAGVEPPRVDLWPVHALATPQGPLAAQR